MHSSFARQMDVVLGGKIIGLFYRISFIGLFCKRDL